MLMNWPSNCLGLPQFFKADHQFVFSLLSSSLAFSLPLCPFSSPLLPSILPLFPLLPPPSLPFPSHYPPTFTIHLISTGVPKESNSLLDLVEVVNNYRKQQPDFPIIIHCR